MPVPPEMPEEMAKVARATSIPIATGERLVTKYEFARVLSSGAANIIQMNLGRVGGLLEAEPDQAGAVLFGARAVEFVERVFADHVVSAWRDNRTSLWTP